MSRSDEYRRNAAECRRMAEATRDESDKRSWLRLAESWMRLVGVQPDEQSQGAGGSFETQPHARDARQRESEALR